MTPIPRSTPWRAEAFRASFLYPSPELPAPQSLWNRLFGNEPDRIENRPNVRTKQEVGNVFDGQLVIMQQPGRVDLILSPDPNRSTAEVPHPVPLSIGPYQSVSQKHEEASCHLLKIIPRPSRLAFAPTVVIAEDTYDSLLKRFQEHVPSARLSQDVTDIVWQINRPRTSLLDRNVKINRIMRWEIFRVHTLAIQVGGVPVTQVSASPLIEGLKLTMDINTHQESALPASTDALVALFQEMKQLTDEICEHGDVT